MRLVKLFGRWYCPCFRTMSFEKVYRRLSKSEKDRLVTQGRCTLEGLSPNSEVPMIRHILDGTSPSKFVATCKSTNAIQRWMEIELRDRTDDEVVVEIDIARLRRTEHVDIIDLTENECYEDISCADEEKGKAKKIAQKYEEVFIVGEIPSEFVRRIPVIQLRPSRVGLHKVYRRLRHNESVESGLGTATMHADQAVLEHVRSPSMTPEPSKYTSCCKTLDAMRRWSEAVGDRGTEQIVEIHLARLLQEDEDVKAIDLTNENVRTEYIGDKSKRNIADLYKEVLVVGMIPSKYMRLITLK